MKIAFNPSTVAALTSPPKNKDITFDLRGRNIFARGVEFKGTDTNTWRDIKINNVSIGSNILDLRNGSNTTLTNTNGVVTINSTWRPVVDNLTSDSTTSSLSANQGRVLKSLIDGKSDSGHNHDGRYVRYYAVTALDCNNLAVGLTVARITATNAAHTNHSAYLYISDVGTPFQLQIPDSSVPYIYKRYYGSGKWSGWFKLNAGYADSAGSVDWGNVTNKPATATRWPSWGEVTGKPDTFTPSSHNHDGRYVYNYGGTQMDGSSRNKNALGMSTTSGISGDWWHILQAAWNDEYRWNSQIAFPTQNRNGMYYRSGLDDNTKWGAWVKLLDSNNYNTFHHLLTNGNTTVSTSTWTNPFSAYNKNAIADGQAICVWGQNSRKYSDNEKFSTDTGDMSLWLKRVNANAATLNMVLDGEYYANGNQRLAHVSEIPNKNSWNYDDRYLKLTGGTLKGQIILPDIDVNTSYTGSIIIGASNTENLGIDGNEIMARNNGKASTLYLNNEGGVVQLGAILRTNSNIAYIGSQSTQNMIKFINNTNDSYGNGIAIGGGGLTIIGSGESSDVVMSQHSSGGDENMIIAGDGNIDFYSNLQDGWKYGKHMYLDTNGFLFTPSYINIGGNENNNSSPDRVWGSNSSDSYLRSYRTSALRVAYAINADTVDGYHENSFLRYRGHTNTDQEATLWNQIGIKEYHGALPDGLTGIYNWGGVISLPGIYSRFEIYASHLASAGNGLYYRSGWGDDKKSWLKFIDSSNIGSQSVASATKLQTARKLWGQSFDGTADVNGTIYINNGDSKNGAIILNNNVNTHARISAIQDQVVFNTGSAIRFGGTEWEYSDWAGLKYDTTANTIYLGIAEGTVFNYNEKKRSNGILRLPGITTVTPDSGARIGNSGGNLYLGNSSNAAWVKVQDICSQNGSDYWNITQTGNATFKYIKSKGNADIVGTLKAGQIIREASGQTWVNGRNGALLRETSVAGYHALWSLKTTNGSWDFGEYNAGSAWNNIPVLTYITDSNYNSGNNTPTYQIKFPLASGTVALTSQASSFDVNTAQYLRSLGNQNCQTGRTQAYGDVYSYNTYNNTGSPTSYTSVIGFGRGIAGTVEIAGGWSNTNLYWRSLRDCCEDWYSWRTVLDSNNYTDFIGSYYWANVKISTSSSTSTSPTVSTLTATSSVKAGNICLEHTDEINHIANGDLYLNYRSPGNVNLCKGGGRVGIGFTSPTQKLDVDGAVQAFGFRHANHALDDAVLLAGGGYGKIFTDKSYNYTDSTKYNLTFHKLSGFCNNLIWVDGYVYGSVDIYFTIDANVYPYRYNNDSGMDTVYVMSSNNYISVGTNGHTHVKSGAKYRVGFFYTGRA